MFPCDMLVASLPRKHGCCLTRGSLQTQLGSSPVSLLGVVPDFITSFHLNLFGSGTILLLFLGQELHDPESLVRRRGEDQSQPRTPPWPAEVQNGQGGEGEG